MQIRINGLINEKKSRSLPLVYKMAEYQSEPKAIGCHFGYEKIDGCGIKFVLKIRLELGIKLKKV